MIPSSDKDEVTKICNNCDKEFPSSFFYTVQKRNKPVLWHWCKECCKKKKDREYQRDWDLKKKYNISLDEYNKNCMERNNSCDICCTKVKTLHVDHCHSTGKVRGYLCGSCNRGLGLLKDSLEVLNKAADYLRERNK